mgnify:CR=1 FL=1
MILYEFTSKARKDIKKLSPEIAERIIKKLDYFVSMANPLGYADHLTNYEIGNYRFRIGDYRVIFDIYEDKIVILKIGHRREIYR